MAFSFVGMRCSSYYRRCICSADKTIGHMKAIQAIVSGRVQKVMYRDFAQRKARALGIVGTVKNLADGTVEIYAEGAGDALEAYVALLKKGSVLSRVDAVQLTECAPSRQSRDFDILF